MSSPPPHRILNAIEDMNQERKVFAITSPGLWDSAVLLNKGHKPAMASVYGFPGQNASNTICQSIRVRGSSRGKLPLRSIGLLRSALRTGNLVLRLLAAIARSTNSYDGSFSVYAMVNARSPDFVPLPSIKMLEWGGEVSYARDIYVELHAPM